jgi:hypothetical protein
MIGKEASKKKCYAFPSQALLIFFYTQMEQAGEE